MPIDGLKGTSLTEVLEGYKKTQEEKTQACAVNADGKTQELAVVEETKSITSVGIEDIRVKLDSSQSYESQAEDVVGMIATAKAIQDEKVAAELTQKKADELVSKASAKASKAQAEATDAETEKQKAERTLYEAVLNTFGIYKHLPAWLMKTLVTLFSPIFVALNLIIGIPCGIVKVIIENIDGIVIKYNDSDEQAKPKIRGIFKALFWLTILIVGIVVVFAVLRTCGVKI